MVVNDQSPMMLSPLREELSVHPAGLNHEGERYWVIEDPVNHRFYELDIRSYEILRAWPEADVAIIAARASEKSGFTVSVEEVAEFAEFLEQSQLVQQPSGQRLYQMWQAGQRGWLSRLLHGYLFFRVPLLRPHRLLAATESVFALCYSRLFWWFVAFLGVIGLGLVVRQWDVFFATFSAFGRWQDWLWFAAALVFSKCIHEWGHALSAHRYGCRVPSMGVAFLVMWPVLYTDTNAAWKLTARRQRLVIAASGMAAELALAVVATWGWLLTPDGGLRSAFFFLASTAWLLTLAVNLNPFMRFDGYFLLSDGLKQPNLHERSFAVGRWWLRKLLFGLDDPKPERLSPRMTRFMVLFAWGTWLYRFVLFLGIALLVYHFFFKLLGAFLMVLELVWFIGMPVYREFAHWWQRRAEIRHQRRVWLPISLLVLCAIWLVVPWSSTVRAPALIEVQASHEVLALEAANVTKVAVERGQVVKQDELLIAMASPDLAFEQNQIEQDIKLLQWQLSRQTASERLLAQGDLIRERLARAQQERQRLLDQQAQLNYVAPFSGEVVDLAPELAAGRWVKKGEPLLLLADTQAMQVVAFVAEDDMAGLALDKPATIYAENLSLPAFECQQIALDALAVSEVTRAPMVSTLGGAVAVTESAEGAWVPSEGVYRAVLRDCDLPLEQWQKAGVSESVATAHLSAQPESLLVAAWRRVYGLLLRETAF